MKMDKSFQAKVKQIEQDILYYASRGDDEGILTTRSEFFNLVAGQCKKEGEVIPLYIMAICEEATKKGLPFTERYFHTLFTIYCCFENGLEILENYHADAMSFIERSLVIIRQVVQEKSDELKVKQMEQTE